MRDAMVTTIPPGARYIVPRTDVRHAVVTTIPPGARYIVPTTDVVMIVVTRAETTDVRDAVKVVNKRAVVKGSKRHAVMIAVMAESSVIVADKTVLTVMDATGAAGVVDVTAGTSVIIVPTTWKSSAKNAS